MSLKELEDALVEFKQRYQELKRVHAVTPLENPLKLRMLRRTVARIATELTVKKIIVNR